MRLIDADTLTQEIKSLSMSITGLRAGKGVLNEFGNEYRKSVIRIIDEQPTLETDKEITSLKARHNYLEALVDAWESNAQSGSNLVHKYRELLIKAKEELAEYQRLENEGLLFDITKQMDLEGAKRIILTLLENQIGVPIPKEQLSEWVDDFLR